MNCKIKFISIIQRKIVCGVQTVDILLSQILRGDKFEKEEDEVSKKLEGDTFWRRKKATHS